MIRHPYIGICRCDGPILPPYGLGIRFGFRTGLHKTSLDDVGLDDLYDQNQYAVFAIQLHAICAITALASSLFIHEQDIQGRQLLLQFC